MRNTLLVVVLAALGAPLPGSAQVGPIAEPFKVGTFEIDGRPQIGIVLRDQLIVELDAANLSLERDEAYPTIPLPADMTELIERYEYGLQRRLYEIVNNLTATNQIDGARADFIHDLSEVRTLPPRVRKTVHIA